MLRRGGVLQDNLVLSSGLETNARKVTFRISLRWPVHIINLVDKTKLSCYVKNLARTESDCVLSYSFMFLGRVVQSPIKLTQDYREF